ncbi:MAG: hypothetical protein J0M15_07845 [Deltaproteobacteria bacterium]|nr:hypothetical protein [Deltaproteobacteria bacterium]
MLLKKLSSKIYYLFWLFLTFTMFIIPIKFFDFYSDDFGYFLNFNNQLRNETSFANALISYLTGGVPRLQLGWHLTHQILYAFIGTNVIWYFVIQSIVIFANCVLLFKLLQNYIENKLAFIITTFFLINCYYIESYYWVSANYCFYQVFFLLASFLLFNKSLEIPKGFFKYLYIFSSSFALLLSVLYQEQSLPFLIGASIILFFLNKNQVKQRTLLLQNLVYLFLTLLLLLLTFLPQVLLISQSSSTSLVDTFRMYYPSPIDSSFENLKYIFRKAFLGFIPEYKVLSMLLNNLHNIDKELKKVLMLQITFFLAFGLFFYKLLTKANSEEKPNQFKMNHWIAILGWFFGTIIVVLPIKYFVSRYVYFILPPAIIIFFLLTKRFIHLKLYNLVILLFFLISFSHNLSFLYGAYFPLIQIERKVAPLILKSLRDDNIIKAIVFEQFPSNIEGITSGVFLNYHATEWWLRWRSLPQDIGAKVVGINASPCVTEKNEPGFMLAYGEYPKERLQKCFSMEETLFVRLESSIYDSKPIINIIKKKPIYLKISNLENINKGLRSFYYFDSNIDFSSCEVRVKANINTNGIANIRLYSKGQERFMERLVVNSSGSGNTTNIELAGSEVATQKGPYQLGFSVSKPIFSDPDEKLFLKINSLEFSACKNDQFIEKFYENHNPDPNNPYMRWINLKNNFSIQIPYKESMIWEKYFGIGINNASNTGDFYCFPDDELIFTNLNTKTTSESYLGMLKWNRTEKIDSDQILINFDRNPNLLTFEHSTKDKMLIEEFKTYKKSIPPLDIKISHLFQLKKPYSKTSITLKSRSKEPGFFKWTFQDSSVFDFNVGTDRGVETISNDLQIKNQQFLSKNKNIFPITYRIMAPIHRNMAVFEWSCSKYLDYYFTSDSPSSQNEVEFSDVLKLQNVYSKNENLPHRNHGLVFKGFIKPNEEIKLTYFKSIITDWENIDELKSKTDNLVNILKTKECSHE